MRMHEQRVAIAITFVLTAASAAVFGPKTLAHAAGGDQHASRQAIGDQHSSHQAADGQDPWLYPVASQAVAADFWAPNGDYSAGHRGIDFASYEGEPVVAVAGATVRFAGQVAGRGVVSLDLESGLVAEVEPVCPEVVRGERVEAGQTIATFCPPAVTSDLPIDSAGPASSDVTRAAHAGLHLSARRFSPSFARGFAYYSPRLFLGNFAPSRLVAIGSLD